MISERILKGAESNGYLYVGLSKDGVLKSISVHQLVAITFLGHTPCGKKMEVDHINGLRDDNFIENLRIVSHEFNCSHGFKKNRKFFTPLKIERQISKKWSEVFSEYIGVYWSKEKKMWYAKIAVYGVYKRFGYYRNEADAARRYESELSLLHRNIDY